MEQLFFARVHDSGHVRSDWRRVGALEIENTLVCSLSRKVPFPFLPLGVALVVFLVAHTELVQKFHRQ